MSGPVYVGSAQWVAATPGNRTVGLFRTSTPGAPWERLTSGLPENAEIRAIEVHPTDAGTLYVATQRGPYRSTDGGDSWESLDLPSPEVTWSILVHPVDPNIVYCGTIGTGIYRSENGGRHWRLLEIAPPVSVCQMGFPTRVIRLAIDPTLPDDIYAALEVGGLVRSLDGGHTWSDCNHGLLGFCEQAAYKSRIGSDTDTEGMLDSHSLAISAAKPGTVFLANRMGLFQSADKGETWEDLDIGRFSPLTYARDVKVSPQEPRTLYGAFSKAAVSDEGSLFRSDDLGMSWSRFDHDVSMESTLMVIGTSRSSEQRVYCAARRGQVFGTEDGGATWLSYRLPAGVEGVYGIACP